MARGTGSPIDPDKLIADFKQYDRSVDVVSAYHWLFTDTKELPATVSHFERYPKIQHSDGNAATPDFTVLFKDGTGIAAEIANLALHDNSVEKLCKQLERYAALRCLPDATGGFTPVDVLDVIFLSPMETADAAVQRVLRDRLDSPEHWFKPKRRPVLIEFAANPDRYVFRFWPEKSVNGTLHMGDRNPNYADFKEPLKISPVHFGPNKIRYGFMNDPVPPLYMATRLWMNVFPSEFGTGATEFTATALKIAGLLRAQYQHGTADDVRAAMGVLVAAGLAAQTARNTWSVTRRSLRRDDHDVHVAIAERVGSLGKRLQTASRPRRNKTQVDGQGTLFDQAPETTGPTST